MHEGNVYMNKKNKRKQKNKNKKLGSVRKQNNFKK